MKKQCLTIKGIPAVLWGEASDRLFIAVHGDQSNKEDEVIAILSEEAANKGYQVLSFDLPEHGDRKEESHLCNVQNCIEDLSEMIDYARTITRDISLFGCSLGAYFSMMTYNNEPLQQALFLSPVVDMRRVIENMMMWFDVSKERLQQEKEISTPVKMLNWDYYQYVVQHPVQWNKPTAILYGKQDTLCEYEHVKKFSDRTRADLTVMEEGEHFFQTPEQLLFFRSWLGKVMS